MKLKRLFLFAAFFLENAIACYTPKPEQKSSYQDLIKRTANIVYVEVIDAKEQAGIGTSNKDLFVYKLKILETLKGDMAGSFYLNGIPAKSYKNEDFSNHSDSKFWNLPASGRVGINADCSISPDFTVGKRYLVFKDEPYHLKSFEKINSPKDKWYLKVRELTFVNAKK